MNDLKSEIGTTMGEVITLDKESVQIIEKMPKGAANMWLELAVQRCRICIVVSESQLESAEHRVEKALKGNLKLISMPSLKRFGEVRPRGSIFISRAR